MTLEKNSMTIIAVEPIEHTQQHHGIGNASLSASDNAMIEVKDHTAPNEDTEKKADRTRLYAYIGLVITPVFWAGNFLFARLAVNDVPPMAISLGRWLLAMLIILPFGLPYVIKQKNEIRRHGKQLLLLAILGISTYNSILYFSAYTTTAINMTLVAATLPLTTILLAWLILKETPSQFQVWGVALSLLGLLIIIGKGSLEAITSISFNPGDILMITATICWAMYTVLYRKWQIKLHPIALITVLIAIGIPTILPFYIWELWEKGGIDYYPHLSVMFIYIAIFPSILAFLFWNKGIMVIGPSVTSLFMYLVPLFTAILSVPLLGEKIHEFHFWGGALIFAGLLVASVINDKFRKA